VVAGATTEAGAGVDRPGVEADAAVAELLEFRVGALNVSSVSDFGRRTLDTRLIIVVRLLLCSPPVPSFPPLGPVDDMAWCLGKKGRMGLICVISCEISIGYPPRTGVVAHLGLAQLNETHDMDDEICLSLCSGANAHIRSLAWCFCNKGAW